MSGGVRRKGKVRAVEALAVDNEPEPFWTGADEVHRVEQWMSQVGGSDGMGRRVCGLR